MADKLHSAFTPADGIHVIHAWTAFSRDQLASIGATSDDVGRVARVGDGSPYEWWVYCGIGFDGPVWRRIDDTPSTGGDGGADVGDAEPTYIQAFYQQSGGEGEGYVLTVGEGKAGTSTYAAREDHAHAVITAVAQGLDHTSRNDEGIGPELARADHRHDVRAAIAASVVEFGQSATYDGVGLAGGTYCRYYGTDPATVTIGTDEDHVPEPPYHGWSVVFAQVSTGKITLVAAPGVTLTPATLTSRTIGSWLVAIKVGNNAWDISGDSE